MGYAKYTEDIREEIDINLAKVTPAYYEFRARIVSTCKCLFCDEEFLSNDALFVHMRQSHNTLPTTLQLNGKIIEPGEHIEAAIESLRLFPVKNIDSFLLNGKSQNAVIVNGNIDLQRLLGDELQSLTVEVDGREWTIYRSNLCTINPDVNRIIAKLNDSVIKRERPELEDLKRQINAHNFDIRDEQYIYGFYEYCLACLLKGAEKDALYYSAYNKMLPYIKSDPRARLVVKIICLRYIWIDRLDELCKGSKPNEFSLVCNFFLGAPLSGQVNDGAHSDNMFEVFVEDDEYDNSQAIVCFMNGDLNAVKRYLGKASRMIEEGEIGENLRDKIYLLQARFSEHTGDIGKAKYYYNRILCPSIKKSRGVLL